MIHQVHTLSNGLEVILIDTKAFPTLTTLLLIGAGSRYENTENNGIAHFFEHMAFKGSQKYPNSFVISSTIEGLGGVFNAYTAKDHTGYWIKSTNEHFETVVDVLADMVRNSLLLDEEIDREKGVIIEEINMYEDTPQSKVADLFENLLYANTSLGFDIVGTKKTVAKFNKQTFVDYMTHLYHPKNAVLVVAGGLNNVKRYLEIIENKFGSWENGRQSEITTIKEAQDRPQITIKHKKTEQTHFCLGFRTFSFFDPRKHTLSLLATILGSGMSSRLFIQVRERRGLCYYIYTGRELYYDVGNIVTQAGVSNDLDKIKQAIEITLAEHKKIIQGDIKAEELIKAKALMKGRLLLSMEDSSNMANFFGTKKILENKIETPQEVITKIEAVNLEQVNTLAKEIFRPENLNLALIGPYEKNDDFGSILNI